MKIVDLTALMVEDKDATQLEAEENDDVVLLKENQKAQADDYVDIDSTENIRTVIVNLESDKNTFDRYQINIDWTVQ